MEKQISPKIAALTFGILIICFAMGFYIFAWEEPTCDPSIDPQACNVDAPLNVSPTAQIKSGDLSATRFLDTDNSSYFVNPAGESVLGGSLWFGSVGDGKIYWNSASSCLVIEVQ